MSASSDDSGSSTRIHLVVGGESVKGNGGEQVIQQPNRIDYGAFMSNNSDNDEQNEGSNSAVGEHDIQLDNRTSDVGSGVTPRNLSSPNHNNSSSSLRDKVSNLTGMFTNRIASFKKKNIVQSDLESNGLLSNGNTSGGGGSYYMAPLPKCDWQVETPKKLGDMYDDVVNYMFMFMPPPQLVKIGSINKRFRDLSSNDEIWSPIYNSFDFEEVEKDTSITREFRNEFIKKIDEKNTLTMRRKYAEEELPYRKAKQTWLQISYGFIAPQVFLASFLIFLILVPLLMDGLIDIGMVGYCSLPFFFAFGCYMFTTYCLVADPLYFQPKKRKLIQTIPNCPEDPNWALNPEESPADDGIRDSVNLFVWHLWIWLLFILMLISKYIWFAALSAPFTALFIPCYVFSIVYCIAPLTYFCYRNSNDITSESKLMYRCSYFTNSLTVLVSALQILLIGLKLDEVITTYWNVVLIPAWIFLIFVNCMCCWYCGCASMSSSPLNGCYATFGAVSHCVFALFYQVWFIIFALRLDNIFIAQYTALFVPMWLFIIAVGCFHCLCGGGAIAYRIFKD